MTEAIQENEQPPPPRHSIPFIIVGTASILLALLGFWYNLSSLSSILKNPDIGTELDAPYFKQSYLIMTSICLLCYLSLSACGIQFLRSKSNLTWLFIGTLIFEFIYTFSIGILWFIPKIGMSIAAATGLANGGIMFQYFCLFPLWSIPLLIWANKKRKHPTTPTP